MDQRERNEKKKFRKNADVGNAACSTAGPKAIFISSVVDREKAG